MPKIPGQQKFALFNCSVASDTLRFAIKQLDRELTAEQRQDTDLLLLDALDRLARAEGRFRIERAAIDRARLSRANLRR